MLSSLGLGSFSVLSLRFAVLVRGHLGGWVDNIISLGIDNELLWGKIGMEYKQWTLSQVLILESALRLCIDFRYQFFKFVSDCLKSDCTYSPLPTNCSVLPNSFPKSLGVYVSYNLSLTTSLPCVPIKSLLFLYALSARATLFFNYNLKCYISSFFIEIYFSRLLYSIDFSSTFSFQQLVYRDFSCTCSKSYRYFDWYVVWRSVASCFWWLADCFYSSRSFSLLSYSILIDSVSQNSLAFTLLNSDSSFLSFSRTQRWRSSSLLYSPINTLFSSEISFLVSI